MGTLIGRRFFVKLSSIFRLILFVNVSFFVVEFSTRCPNCPQVTLRGAQCYSCGALGLQCVICHVAVRGNKYIYIVDTSKYSIL